MLRPLIWLRQAVVDEPAGAVDSRAKATWASMQASTIRWENGGSRKTCARVWGDEQSFLLPQNASGIWGHGARAIQPQSGPQSRFAPGETNSPTPPACHHRSAFPGFAVSIAIMLWLARTHEWHGSRAPDVACGDEGKKASGATVNDGRGTTGGRSRFRRWPLSLRLRGGTSRRRTDCMDRRETESIDRDQASQRDTAGACALNATIV